MSSVGSKSQFYLVNSAVYRRERLIEASTVVTTKLKRGQVLQVYQLTNRERRIANSIHCKNKFNSAFQKLAIQYFFGMDLIDIID